MYTLIFVGIQLVVSGLVSIFLKLLSGSEPSQSVTLLLASQTAVDVIIIALFLFLRWTEVSRSYIRSKPWAVLFWCCIAAVGAVVPSVWLQEQMPELPNIMEQQFDMILKDRWGYFVIGLLAPVCEELVFRGAILRSLLQWKPEKHWVPIAISAFLFALVHGNPAQMPHAFVVGLLLGWLYYRTGSVVPGVAYHWMNNSIAYVCYNLYPNPDMKLIDLFGTQRTVAAAVLFSLFILLPALYQLNLRMRRAA